jgi:hypothetical protein
MMRDPDSFVFESVFTTSTPVIVCETWTCRHKTKVPVTSICLSFRSHNAYGGYGDSGIAVLRESGVLNVLETDSNPLHTDVFHDYGAKISLTTKGEPREPCQAKNLTADITAEVKAALNPPASTPVSQTPADQAKQAQQYADCLKLAVDNPNIVCKQGGTQ